MVLSKESILVRCTNPGKYGPLIENYKENNVKACSYDLTFSGEYYYYQKKDGGRAKPKHVQGKQKLKIPADALCYVLTDETVNMPDDLTATISLSMGLIRQGVMLAAQPPYDPGYKGKTVALLHNLSSEDVEIPVGKHILNIVFSKLDSEIINPNDLYNGDYNNLRNLNQFCDTIKIGAVFKLKEELDRIQSRFQRFMPTIVAILGIILAILTAITGYDVMQGHSDVIRTSNIAINEEEGTLTVLIDGKLYTIDLHQSDETEKKGTPSVGVIEEQSPNHGLEIQDVDELEKQTEPSSSKSK